MPKERRSNPPLFFVTRLLSTHIVMPGLSGDPISFLRGKLGCPDESRAMTEEEDKSYNPGEKRKKYLYIGVEAYDIILYIPLGTNLRNLNQRNRGGAQPPVRRERTIQGRVRETSRASVLSPRDELMVRRVLRPLDCGGRSLPML